MEGVGTAVIQASDIGHDERNKKDAFIEFAATYGISAEDAGKIFDGADKSGKQDYKLEGGEVDFAVKQLNSNLRERVREAGNLPQDANNKFTSADEDVTRLLTGDEDGEVSAQTLSQLIRDDYIEVNDGHATITDKGKALLGHAEAKGGLQDKQLLDHINSFEAVPQAGDETETGYVVTNHGEDNMDMLVRGGILNADGTIHDDHIASIQDEPGNEDMTPDQAREEAIDRLVGSNIFAPAS